MLNPYLALYFRGLYPRKADGKENNISPTPKKIDVPSPPTVSFLLYMMLYFGHRTIPHHQDYIIKTLTSGCGTIRKQHL